MNMSYNVFARRDQTGAVLRFLFSTEYSEGYYWRKQSSQRSSDF